jgi:pimeloyl-ACP methyl ester carboxylesterase
MLDRPEDNIAKLPHPMLLIRGERDSIAPRAWLEELRRRGENVEIAEVEGAAHTVDYAKPEAAARLVRDFLDRP